MGRRDEAEQTRRRAVEIQNGLAANLPNDVGVRTSAGGCLNNLAESLIATGQLTEARQLLEQAVVHQRAALKIDPANAQSQDFLGNHFLLLTEVHVLSGDEDAVAKAAQDVTQFCLTDCDDLIVTATQYIEVFIDRAAQCMHDATRSQQQQESGAKARFLLAKALIREAVQRTPDDPKLWMIANVLTTAPEPLRDPDLALRLARRAVELEPGSGFGTDSLGWALFRAGDYRASLDTIGRQSEAGTCSFVRVMDLWQLGEQTEAGDHIAKANQWLIGYERECEETSKQRSLKYPLPAQLKRLQAEAAAMLGVPLPTVEPAPAPARKVEEAQELPKSTPALEPPKAEETPQ
jgi:tetratricopeptide (TPR) repeat protein